MSAEVGPAGPQGPAGTGHTTIRTNTLTLPPSSSGSTSTVGCVGATTLTGGGYDITDDTLSVHVTASKPEPGEDWKIFATNTDPFSSHTVEVYALCVGS